MASVNLSSLSTFWQSIKSYLHSKFSDRTRLYNGTGETSITLSESVDNFEYLEIFIYATQIAYGQEREMVRFKKTSTSGINFRIPFFNNNGSYNILGIATFSVSANGLSMALVSNNNYGRLFSSSSGYTKNNSLTFYITRVYGIRRIQN